MKYGDATMGQYEAAINKLGGWEAFLSFLAGNVEVVVKDHIIDCDADPFTPNGWKVEEHRKGGQLKWDPKKVTLHLSPNQLDNKVVVGDNLRAELANMPVMNANVADYLLAHPELIPDEWKGKVVFFWGTIYRHSDGSLCVRFLDWSVGRWRWSGRWLVRDWRVDGPAAVLAS